LRIIAGLSVGVEIDFIDASLPRGAWLGVPRVSAQLDLAEFLLRNTTPVCGRIHRVLESVWLSPPYW